MSRFTNLTLLLSLAACEQSAPSQNPPVFPEATTAPAPAPTPKPEPAPATPPPAVAPVKPAIVKKPVATPAVKAAEPAPKIGKPGCRPGSRMACRWEEGDDERLVPRVTQKPAPGTDAGQP